jgi:hypothetical protein
VPRYRVAEGDDGVGLGSGFAHPLPSRLGDLGERRELSQRGPEGSLGSFSLFTICFAAFFIKITENLPLSQRKAVLVKYILQVST